MVVKDFAPSHKLATNFKAQEFTVLERKGKELVVRADDTGVEYRRNVAHTKRIPGASIDEPPVNNAPTNVRAKRQAPKEDGEAARPKRTIVKPIRFK